MSVKVVRTPTNVNFIVVCLYDYDSSRPDEQGLIHVLKRANFPNGSIIFANAQVYGGTYCVTGVSMGSYQSYMCHTYWAKSSGRGLFHIMCQDGVWSYETL